MVYVISVKLFLANGQVKYVPDDSTTFWAIGPESSIIAKAAEFCGKEVEMVVPFEGVNSGEVWSSELFFLLMTPFYPFVFLDIPSLCL